MKTPPKVKYELLINGAITDITNDVSKWEDLETDYSREDVKSVYVNISAPVNFIGDAYNTVKELYEKDSFNAVCTLIISIRNDNLTDVRALWNYVEKFRSELDFSTYIQNETFIKINIKENGLAAKIKANKSTVYDIPVSDLITINPIAPSFFEYDRLKGINRIFFNVIPNRGDEIVFKSFESGDMTMGLSSEELMYDEKVNITNSDGEPEQVSKVRLSDKGLIRIEGNSPTYLSVDFRVKCDYAYVLAVDFAFIFKADNGSTETIAAGTEMDGYIRINNALISSSSGYLILRIGFTSIVNYPEYVFKIVDFKKIEVNYTTRAAKVNIDSFSIENLLSSLMQKIAGDGVATSVDLGLSNKIRLLSAESIRAIPKAKVHTSFEKLYKSLKAVFGLEYDIEDNKISFRTRDSLFENVNALDVEDVTDVILSVNSDHIYSNVKIGFKKSDNEKGNGKEEFRFANQFTTGVTNSTKKLELISDYRADAWGIEFLAQRRGDKTTDDSSDEDIFFVDVKESSRVIELPGGITQVAYFFIPNRDIPISGNTISTDSMFNAIFSPRQCLLRNKKYLGASTSTLTFASAEGNSDVTINGVKETDSVNIPKEERLFMPDKLEIKVGKIIETPIHKNGYISFTHKGKKYTGYIDNLKHNYGRDKHTTWTLFRRD